MYHQISSFYLPTCALTKSSMSIYSFRSVWKKKFFNREKKREIAFRHKLIDKVRTAEKFDPEVCKVLFKLMNSKCLMI